MKGQVIHLPRFVGVVVVRQAHHERVDVVVLHRLTTNGCCGSLRTGWGL